jgi:hypothetical protein
MNLDAVSRSLENILGEYEQAFGAKVFDGESSEEDDLMLVFGLTQTIKAKNKQYWGRQLGMCWQRIVTELCRQICDLVVGKDAIDTKYRIGSGDSGTLKKFKQYAARLEDLGYRPVLLILREDNLPAAITACLTGGWTVMTGSETHGYLREITGFDLQAWLKVRRDHCRLSS